MKLSAFGICLLLLLALAVLARFAGSTTQAANASAMGTMGAAHP